MRRYRWDELSDEQLKRALADRTETERNLRLALREKSTEVEQVRAEIARRKAERIENGFILRREHVLLLREMYFDGLWYGDDVSIGVDGKRPFGNSGDIHEDVARILGWEINDDYGELSGVQVEAAQRLLDELAMAVNAIIAGVDVPQ